MVVSSPSGRRPNQPRPPGVSPLAALSIFLEITAIVALASLAIVALTIPAFGSLEFAKNSYLVANVAAYVAVVLARDRGGVSVMIAFFFLFFVAIPANTQIDQVTFPFGSVYSAEQLVNTYILLAVAQVAYLLGSRAAGLRRPHPDRIYAGLEPSAALTFGVTLISLSLALGGAVGPAALFAMRGDTADSAGSDEGIQTQLLFMGRSLSLVALLVVLLVFIRSTSIDRRRISLWVALCTAAATCLILNFPPALPRFQLLGALLAVCAPLLNLFRPIIKALFTALSVVFLFFLFPAIKALGSGRSIDVAAAFTNDVSGYLLRVDFDAFKQMADTIIYLQNQPLRFGENFLGVLLFWVPRSAWPDKPIPSGALVSSALGYPYTNVSSPLPAEAVLGFGPIGVLAVLGALGVLVAHVEAQVLRTWRTKIISTPVIFYALLIGFSTIIMRGALNSVAPMFMTAFAAYFCLRVLAQKRSRTLHSRTLAPSGSLHVPHQTPAAPPPPRLGTGWRRSQKPLDE